jgi:hypothetical protein
VASKSKKEERQKIPLDLTDTAPTYEMSFGSDASNVERPQKIRKLTEEGISKTLTLTSYYVLVTH